MTDAHESPQSDHGEAATTERVEVTHPNDPAASAQIETTEGSQRIASVGLHTGRGCAEGTHRELVDQVMSHPIVADSDKVHAVVALGDAETITRLQEHTVNFEAHAAGASTIIDADVAPASSD